MAHRSIASVRLAGPRPERADGGPSPFPLLILTIVIGAIFLLRLELMPPGDAFSLSSSAPVAQPSGLQVMAR